MEHTHSQAQALSHAHTYVCMQTEPTVERET